MQFFELFLREFDKLESEKQDLLLQLRNGRNVWPIAQQLGILEIRTNELDRIFTILKGWY
jgi:hypothetical protein